MFLETTNTDSATDDNVADLAADPNVSFLGEDYELIQLMSEASDSIHNLTLAMSRLEHKAVVTENTALFEEGKDSYFKKVVEAVKAYWAKFVAWVRKAVDQMVNAVFGPRRKWLEKNKGALTSKKDFGDVEVSVGKNLMTAKFDSMVESGQKAIERVSVDIGGNLTREELTSLSDKAVVNLGGEAGKDSIASAMQKTYLGESSKVKLDSGTVGKLIGVAETTFANGPKLNALTKIAALTVKMAEQQVAVAASDATKARMAIDGIKALGPIATATVAAIRGVNGSANAQAMSALTTALHSGPKAGAQNESTEKDILDRFM